MTGNWKGCIAAALCTAAVGQVPAQAPRVATLDIEWENGVSYVDDLLDPSRLVTSPAPVSASVRNFMTFAAIGDIVSVNGKTGQGVLH